MNTPESQRTTPFPPWMMTLIWAAIALLAAISMAAWFTAQRPEAQQAAVAGGAGTLSAMGTMAFGLCLLALYGLPTIIAYRRDHRNYTALMVANLLLGWTLLGWVACLIWALLDSERRAG